MYLELFVVLESENDPLESFAETYFSNPATYEKSIGELVLGLVMTIVLRIHEYSPSQRLQY